MHPPGGYVFTISAASESVCLLAHRARAAWDCLTCCAPRLAALLCPALYPGRPALVPAPFRCLAAPCPRHAVRCPFPAVLVPFARAGPCLAAVPRAGAAELPFGLRGRRGRTLNSLRLIVLLHYGFLRLVTIIPGLQRLLLLRMRIPIARILPLVCRQRSRRRNRIAIPVVPSAVILRPRVAPMLVPAWRRITAPPVEVRRRMPVIAHRDA